METQVSMSHEWSIDEVIESVREVIDPIRNPHGFQAGVFLAVSRFTGPNELLVRHGMSSMVISRRRSRDLARNLRANGIWQDRRVVVDWVSPSDPAFLLDVLCAEGTHVRVQLKSRKGSYATVPKRSSM